MTGMVILAFVIGFTLGVLAMAFFKGAAMSEVHAKLCLREALLQEMIDDWLKIFVRHSAPPDRLQTPGNDAFSLATASKWVGKRGRMAEKIN